MAFADRLRGGAIIAPLRTLLMPAYRMAKPSIERCGNGACLGAEMGSSALLTGRPGEGVDNRSVVKEWRGSNVRSLLRPNEVFPGATPTRVRATFSLWRTHCLEEILR